MTTIKFNSNKIDDMDLLRCIKMCYFLYSKTSSSIYNEPREINYFIEDIQSSYIHAGIELIDFEKYVPMALKYLKLRYIKKKMSINGGIIFLSLEGKLPDPIIKIITDMSYELIRVDGVNFKSIDALRDSVNFLNESFKMNRDKLDIYSKTIDKEEKTLQELIKTKNYSEARKSLNFIEYCDNNSKPVNEITMKHLGQLLPQRKKLNSIIVKKIDT